MNQDSDDMIEKRKRRSKLRAFRNLLLFLLIVGFCGYLYVQRDMWIPKLEGTCSRYAEGYTAPEVDTIAGGGHNLATLTARAAVEEKTAAFIKANL